MQTPCELQSLSLSHFTEQNSPEKLHLTRVRRAYGDSHSHSLNSLHLPWPLHVLASQSPTPQAPPPHAQLSPLYRSLLQTHFRVLASQSPWPLHSRSTPSMSTSRPGQWLSHSSP